MHTDYDDGFTEALIRNLPDEPFDVLTATIEYDPRFPELGRDLRFAWSGSFRTTIAVHPGRGILLLDELHVPLACELAAAFRRLEDVERLIRSELPPELAESGALGVGVVVYADRWDVLPDDPRIVQVRDESRPQQALVELFGELPDAEPDDVEQLRDALRGRWECHSRCDWLSHYGGRGAA